MIKKIAWDTFKKTGNINTFLEYKQIQDVEEKANEAKQIKDAQGVQSIENIEDIQKTPDIDVENIEKENTEL